MRNLLAIFIPPLNSAGFRYMVTGSVSSMFYGETRLTADVDIVLTLRRDQAKLLAKASSKGLDELWQKHVLSKLTQVS